jgi:hypothetical protein
MVSLLHHCSSSSSKLKPGPIASITPNAPCAGGSATVRRRTSSTDAEEILPLSRIEFRLCASASGARPIAFSIESSTFGFVERKKRAAAGDLDQPGVGERLAQPVAEFDREKAVCVTPQQQDTRPSYSRCRLGCRDSPSPCPDAHHRSAPGAEFSVDSPVRKSVRTHPWCSFTGCWSTASSGREPQRVANEIQAALQCR